METLYLEILSDVDNKNCCQVPIETLIVAFAYKYCNEKKISVVLKRNKNISSKNFQLCLLELPYKIYQKENLPAPANFCKLPLIVSKSGTTCIAGLCAVTRQIFKASSASSDLLGFKQNCLYACAEASLWTRFCEVDAPEATVNIYHDDPATGGPIHLLRYEGHLAQPVRIHNIQKKKQDLIKASNGISHSIPDARLQMTADLNHLYAEGPAVSIADVILFPCFHLMLEICSPSLKNLIPLVTEWHQRMLQLNEVKKSMGLFVLPQTNIKPVYDCSLMQVPQESLYKSDPKRYKPRHRIFTKQADIDESLKIVRPIELKMISNVSYGNHIEFEWKDIPSDAQPQGGGGGALPEERAARKAEQLKAMAKAVLSVAQDGDVIVDFCAGCGHLGILLAYLLKNCTVVLLENKEESMNRARERAGKLNLTNVLFCQTNVDYFTGYFTLGVSLHACGVATDLVLESCIFHNAVFVSCPCCYGSVQTNHVVQYPRSEEFKSLSLTERQYLVLGHAADQTHDVLNEKTMQGLQCMNIIDGDRCLRAQSLGYKVILSKLDPPTCTPKNNLLIGLPSNR